MKIEKFNKLYSNEGGITKLTELRALCYTQKYIANHFGVSLTTVNEWMVKFFGERYDPRQDRKEAIIANMLDFARANPREKFNFAFNNMKSEYYKEALGLCIEQGIYDNV